MAGSYGPVSGPPTGSANKYGGSRRSTAVDLATWRASAIAGKTSPESLAVIEAGIITKLREAQRAAERAGVAAVVRELVEAGGDVHARWHAASLSARRDVVRTMLKITPHSRTGRGRRPLDRVELEWR